MAQDNIEIGRPPAAVARRQRNATGLALATGFALTEGAVASMAILLPALFYHVAVMQVERAPIELYGAFSLFVGLIYGACSAAAAGRYLDRPQKPPTVLADSAVAWTGSVAGTLLLAFLLGIAGDLSRVSLTSAYLIGLPLLMALRNIAYARVKARIGDGLLPYRRIAVVGSHADVENFLGGDQLVRNGYEVVGTLFPEDARAPGSNVPDGAILRFAQRAISRGADSLVLVGSLADLDGLGRVVAELRRLSINVVCAPAEAQGTLKFLDVVPMGPHNALRVLRKPMGDAAVLLKRAVDVIGASTGLVLLSPLFLVVSVAIKLDSPGPVFYRQERRGFNGSTFFIWKFRSMRVTESGRAMTQARRGDPRISRVGAFIRPTNIDELPQLLNVLVGEMSLVGPRPHAIQHDDELGHQLESYAHRQRIKPGITGWAQVNGYRGETSTFEQIEGRTQHDLYYIDNWSLQFDLWILLLTVVSPKARRNAV